MKRRSSRYAVLNLKSLSTVVECGFDPRPEHRVTRLVGGRKSLRWGDEWGDVVVKWHYTSPPEVLL